MANNAYPRLLINPERRKPRHDGGPVMCAVSGCGVKIETKYHRRVRLCKEHVKAPVLLCGSNQMRFCQQCNKLQPRDEFNGIQRNCRQSLIRRQRSGAKGAKTADKKGKDQHDAYHTSDQDSSTVGSDRDMPSFLERKVPFGTGSVFGSQTEEAGQCLSSNVQRSSSREGKDLDSAKIDTGDGENGSNVAKNAHLVRNVPHPVFIRCDSNSSRNGSADIDMSTLISDPEPGSDPLFDGEPASEPSPENCCISEEDLPALLRAPCNCGKCGACLSCQEVTSSTENCWVLEPASRTTVQEPKLLCGPRGNMDPTLWEVGLAYDATDPGPEYFPEQKPKYPVAEGHSVCAAPLQQDQIYPISVNAPAQHPGLREWHDPIPSPLSRDSVCQYQNQQCSSISHPQLAAQASTFHSMPDPVGSNVSFTSRCAGTAQFGVLPRNDTPLATGPCLKHVRALVDVAPDFHHSQGPSYSIPVAMQEPGMMPGSESLRIQQRIECHASTLNPSPAQMVRQASTHSLSSDPYAYACAMRCQAPPERPVNLLRFHRRTSKFPNAGHAPGPDVIQRLAPVVANGNLIAQSRAMRGCVRVVVTVATTESTGSRNVGIAADVDYPTEGFGESSSYSDCRGWPSNDEVKEMQNEETVLERMAGHLPLPASPSAQNLATTNCWIQTEQEVAQVVNGICQEQQDVAEALSNFGILSMRPACFLASRDTDVKILGRGLGDTARMLCSFNEETRVLNLSLTQIRVCSGGKVEIIDSKNMEQAGTADISEALSLVRMAGDKVDVGDVLEMWSGQVRAFHGVGVAYVEAEKKHLLTEPVPVLVVRDENSLADYVKLEQEVEEGRMSVVELQQTREDVGHVLCHLTTGEMVVEMDRAGDRIDYDVHPCNDQTSPEYREMVVNLASWHLGNFCRRGLPCLMRVVLPATLLSGADFAAVAESAFSDGFTLLHYAVMSGNVDTIQDVVDLGTQYHHTWRWDIAGPLGVTPLHLLAVSNNGSSLLQYVASVQPEVTTLWFESASSNGETPENFAERVGNSNLNVLARAHWSKSPSPSPRSSMRWSAITNLPGHLQDLLSLLPGPPWKCGLRFHDSKLENKFKDYRGQSLNESDGLCMLLYLLCCLYVLLMMAVGNCKQPAKVLWREENVLPYLLALLPLGVPLAANWALQSCSSYCRWRESVVVGGCFCSVLTSFFFGLGPMQWFLSRWSSGLFVVGFLARRMSFAAQVRLCYHVVLHVSEIFVALFAALRQGMVSAVFTECFCMIMAMVADMAWTYCEEKHSRLHFLSDNKLQHVPSVKSRRKVD
eukprot:evm.model.scf_313EXC.1 EVM.evm.TU.scf_313EXC.1   scf_313EXC:4820-16342(+)